MSQGEQLPQDRPHLEVIEAVAADIGAAEVGRADAVPAGPPSDAHPATGAEPAADALVDAAKRGDAAALTELHRRYAPVIHAILLARVGPSDADDLAQDVFVSAIRRLGSLSDATRFGGWIATIARNAAVDHHRRKRPVVPLAAAEAAVDAGVSPERRIAAERVLTVIRGLPEAYREVLVMRLVEGMTGPEIAERVGLTPGSVRVNLHRGMKLLRERLEADG